MKWGVHDNFALVSVVCVMIVNNNYNKLHPVAVVVLHVRKYEISN
jgi:hypothetical protein